jgi:N4-gp56 family major capsid protein
MTTNTTTSLGSGTGATATKPNAYYEKLLLELLVQTDFYHAKFAQERPMPKNIGDTINFRKITKLVPSLTPMSEGVTPANLNGQVVSISATTSQHGEWMSFTDLVDVTLVDPVVKEYTIELARAMREKLDLLVREELNAGSNVFYANSRVSRATLAAGDIPKIDDLRKIVLSMKKNFVKPAAAGKYIVLASQAIIFDLLDDAKFIKAHEIGQNNTPFVKGEVADIYGMKFIEMENAKVFTGAGAGSVNVHSTIVLGRQAYGITKINGQGVETYVKPLGSAGTADPLNQTQTIGTKINAFVAKRLEEQAITRYESVPVNN